MHFRFIVKHLLIEHTDFTYRDFIKFPIYKTPIQHSEVTRVSTPVSFNKCIVFLIMMMHCNILAMTIALTPHLLT